MDIMDLVDFMDIFFVHEVHQVHNVHFFHALLAKKIRDVQSKKREGSRFTRRHGFILSRFLATSR